MIPTRAYENGFYLGYANSAGYERGLNYLGQSLIAAPDGKEVARAGPGSEVIHGTLPMETVPAAQSRLPYLKDRASLGTVIL
ncbi:nitrilase-related carbon-nitrogen hydrolase [Ovoidimarina sediminis]|uniref:nitrilase-related carbon-nitrogen hydrolase n=1 Tax=Ovoidimarina sediminis TaxID=3079856 RepID=UPI002912B66F|nr:nitrilase-related carbon-nitrogen hydrolase [Rhodophyticola sp. MJ-SS7]MDU8946238.1 nitrilase-related carbon-nitrogen hydrolase [Rhodophyticola sp. MJ-SS7]